MSNILFHIVTLKLNLFLNLKLINKIDIHQYYLRLI